MYVVVLPLLAHWRLPSLGAIIGVGVACGVEKKVKMCDVLVSTHISGYDKGRAQHQRYQTRGDKIPASIYFTSIFNSLTRWPSDSITKRLDDSKMPIPKVKPGIILSGPYLIDDPELKEVLIEDFAQEAIGIEMEGAYLFAATQQTPIHVIIVKSVCDFGDGKKNKKYQPTAALMAADFVHKVLSKPQVPSELKNKVCK